MLWHMRTTPYLPDVANKHKALVYSYIPGEVPPIWFDSVVCLLRVVPVTQHHVIPTNTQLSFLTSTHHSATVVY